MSLLDLLVSPAAAQAAAAPGQPGSLVGLLFPVALLGLMFFLMIRPQMKRQKEHRLMLEKLAKGDEVISNGGIAGRVDGIGESFVELEIADGVRVKLQKSAIAAVLPKGTLRSA